MRWEAGASVDELDVGGDARLKEGGQVEFLGRGGRAREIGLHREVLEGGQRLILLAQCGHFSQRAAGQQVAHVARMVGTFARAPPSQKQTAAQCRQAARRTSRFLPETHQQNNIPL